MKEKTFMALHHQRLEQWRERAASRTSVYPLDHLDTWSIFVQILVTALSKLATIHRQNTKFHPYYITQNFCRIQRTRRENNIENDDNGSAYPKVACLQTEFADFPPSNFRQIHSASRLTQKLINYKNSGLSR